MIAVRLLRNYGIVNGGEVAGFPAEEAEKMIADGIAVIFDPKAEAAEPAAEPPAEGQAPARRRR